MEKNKVHTDEFNEGEWDAWRGGMATALLSLVDMVRLEGKGCNLLVSFNKKTMGEFLDFYAEHEKEFEKPPEAYYQAAFLWLLKRLKEPIHEEILIPAACLLGGVLERAMMNDKETTR